MTEEQKEEIIKIILKRHPHLKKEDINEEDSLLEDLELDDIDFIEILMDLENFYSIQITDEEWYKVIKIKDIFKLLNNKI